MLGRTRTSLRIGPLTWYHRVALVSIGYARARQNGRLRSGDAGKAGNREMSRPVSRILALSERKIGEKVGWMTHLRDALSPVWRCQQR